MINFQLNFLDHIAIRVLDLDRSANWYERVLGLKRVEIPEWNPYPVFLLSGNFGIALFPATSTTSQMAEKSLVKIDHFAFNVSRSNFDQALEHYRALDLDFVVKNHIYFLSVYTDDPDGHTVELTTSIKTLPNHNQL